MPTFPTLQEAMNHYEDLIRQGTTCVTNRIWNDYFNSCRPRSRFVKILGVEPKAQKFVEKMAPGGHWFVSESQTSQGLQLMAWWNKFAPYAWAMVNCEDGFETIGIEHQSVNSYYGTVCGFVDLGFAEFMDNEDHDLFSKIYHASMRIKSPSLPFDEAFQPCFVFTAVRHPKMFAKKFEECDWIVQHAIDVLNEIEIPVPKHLSVILTRSRGQSLY